MALVEPAEREGFKAVVTTRPTQSPRKSRRRGFTLIELVLALGAAAFLAASLYATLNVAFNAEAAATAAVEPSRTADLAMEFIRLDLQNAMPPHDPSTYTSEFQYLAGAFQGQSNAGATGNDADLVFFSTAPMKEHPSANGEIKMIELTTATVDGKKCLVRKCARNLTTETQPPPNDQEVLCRGVDSFSLRYYDGTNWDDTWDSTQMQPNELPAAVQVILTLDRTPSGNRGGQKNLIKFSRIFQLSTSTAEEDADITSGLPE